MSVAGPVESIDSHQEISRENEEYNGSDTGKPDGSEDNRRNEEESEDEANTPLSRPHVGPSAIQQPEEGKPSLQQSWDVIMRVVESHDEDLVKGYKEDIDTLLVFAGLFSAVVTAFTIESYRWLQEDPGDTTVMLLREIAQQMRGQPTSPSQPFIPPSYAIRINTFWFLSLILALVDALFGLLCKQWLREHQRQARTRTPRQALALRWLRNQSFERWHVPTILASLPILLEIALFLFFLGLLELLRARHLIPFAIALFVIGLTALFYSITTILPGITIIQRVLRIHPSFSCNKPELYSFDIARLPTLDFVCPYKSPQSWLVFRLLIAMYHLPGWKRLQHFFLVKFNPYWQDGWNSIPNLDRRITRNLFHISDWTALDLNVIERFSRIKDCPDLYGLKGFRWLVHETRDIPSMVPHLKNVLVELPGHLVMPTIFDWWGSPVDFDFNSALEFSHGIDDLFNDQSSTHKLSLASQILCFRHLLTTYDDHWAEHDEKGDALARAGEKLWHCISQEPRNGHFVHAFFWPEGLLFGQSSKEWRINLFNCYRRHWNEVNVESQIRLAARLSESVFLFLESSKHDVGSTLLASSYGLDFFTSVHDKILETEKFFASHSRTMCWKDVLNRIRRIHQLPLHYFKPVPGYFPAPPNELKGLLEDSSTSGSVLFPLLYSYQECWINTNYVDRGGVIKELSNHINLVLPVPSRPDQNLPSKDSYSLPSPTSALTSHRGLEFLTYVNERLAENTDFSDWLGHDKGTMNLWTDALERVRVFCGLPFGYFKPISKRDWVTGEIVGYYTPGGKNDGIDNDGGQNLKANGTICTKKDRAGVLTSNDQRNVEAVSWVVTENQDAIQLTTRDRHDMAGGLGAENHV